MSERRSSQWTGARKFATGALSGAIAGTVLLANFEPLRRVLPANSFCWSVRLLGRDCPGCGLTRSMLAVGRGDPGTAMELNWLGPVFFAALIVFLSARLLPDVGSRRRADAAVAILLGAAMIGRTCWFYL